jgi:hypothetical protein
VLRVLSDVTGMSADAEDVSPANARHAVARPAASSRDRRLEVVSFR